MAKFARWRVATALISVCSTAAPAQVAPDPDERPIVITGIRTLEGVRAVDELDANAIAALGADDVGDLLGALAGQTDTDGEGPVVLINGQLTGGLNDIADLPSEVVNTIQVLPRSAAASLGQRPTRRVLNVVIKANHRQLTLLGKTQFATEGDGRRQDAEANFLRLDNGNRRSLVLGATRSAPLYESDRDIRYAATTLPFDPLGNVVAVLPGGEIDPALSLLAGEPVLVAAVPVGVSTPLLSDFVAGAGAPNSGGLGRFRSLIGRQTGGSFNANVTQKFGKHSLSLTVKGTADRFHTRIGASTASLLLPTTSPFSPFAGDVRIATAVGTPLVQDREVETLTAALVGNGPVGTWRYTFNANANWRWVDTRSDRADDLSALQAGVAHGTTNPFVLEPAGFLMVRERDRSRSSGLTAGVQATVSGSPFALPAGPARLSARLEWRGLHGSTHSGSLASVRRAIHRDDVSSAATLQLPILGAGAIGALGFEASGALRHITSSGFLADYGYALNWDPSTRLSVRAAVNNERIAPPPNALDDPPIILDSIRVYDFVRQETVFVSYVTGGNPDLSPERRRRIAIGGTFSPFDKVDLTLTVDFTDVRGKGAFSALPPANAEVQLAFPDRFQRGLDGRLTRVDARPVGFALAERQELKTGLTFNRVIRAAKSPAAHLAGEKGDSAELVRGWRLSAYGTHYWTLKSERQARADLPVIDLLRGGAVGYGGGQERHKLLFGGGVIHNGLGLQVDGTWLGRSTIASGTAAVPDRIRFAPQFLLDARLFANLGPVMPRHQWAKGMRAAVSIDNLFNDKRKVTDSDGNTPFGYQRDLLDPLGRTVTLSLRKAI